MFAASIIRLMDVLSATRESKATRCGREREQATEKTLLRLMMPAKSPTALAVHFESQVAKNFDFETMDTVRCTGCDRPPLNFGGISTRSGVLLVVALMEKRFS